MFFLGQKVLAHKTIVLDDNVSCRFIWLVGHKLTFTHIIYAANINRYPLPILKSKYSLSVAYCCPGLV